MGLRRTGLWALVAASFVAVLCTVVLLWPRRSGQAEAVASPHPASVPAVDAAEPGRPRPPPAGIKSSRAAGPPSAATVRQPYRPARMHPIALVATPWMHRYRQAVRDYALRLSESAAARDRAAAALLLGWFDEIDGVSTVPDDVRGRWLTEAARAAPEDALVQWVAVIQCREDAALGCDPAPALDALQRGQAGNAAVWVVAAADAQQRNDPAGVDRALRQAALAGRYQAPGGCVAQTMFEVLAAVPLPPMDPDFAQAYRIESGGIEPSAQALALGQIEPLVFDYRMLLPPAALRRACSATGARAAAQRADCAAVLSLLGRDGSRFVAESAARQRSALTGPLPPADRERLRGLYWLEESAVRTPDGSLDDERDWAQIGWRDGADAGLRARLRFFDRPLEPPPDWQPSGPGARALVATGRPP